MPTYEYKCGKCGNIQEEMHGITASLEIDCNICGNVCQRIFSVNTNFVLKGGDWPSQGLRIKNQMTKKNNCMKTKMIEREKSGEGASGMSDLK